MELRERYFCNDWDGYAHDLAVTPWTPTKDASVCEATVTIANYHGEGFSGETIRASARYDFECGAVSVDFGAGDSVLQLSAPSTKRMMGTLDALARFRSDGSSQWEWRAIAWLAHQLVKSAHDDCDGCGDVLADARRCHYNHVYKRRTA